MKRTFFAWVSSGVVVLALVGASSPIEAKSLDKSTKTFCTDLAAYAKALNNLYKMSSDDAKEYEKAQKAVDKSFEKVAKAEDKMDKAQNKALNKKHKDLADAVASISKTATPAEMDGIIDGFALEALAAYTDITTTVCTFDSD